MKLRTIIFFLLASVLFLFTVVPAQAVPIWGSDASGELTGATAFRTSPVTSGLHATEDWADGGFTIGWDVSQGSDSLWTYSYTITTVRKDISNLILEVTNDGNPFNTYPGTDTDIEGPKLWDIPLSGSPLMPNSIYGVKFDFGGGTGTTYTMVTDRSPVYGVFYAKDGTSGTNDVVAWSNALNTFEYWNDTSLTTIDFIVRPDGGGWPPNVIPEPATMLLLGSGLIGFAVSGKKKLKKRKG